MISSSMVNAKGANAPGIFSSQAAGQLLRGVLRHRLMLAITGLALAGAGLALGWNWLSAVGVAPLIVAAAPCLAMCALGLCMMGRGKQGCSNQAASAGADEVSPPIPSATVER